VIKLLELKIPEQTIIDKVKSSGTAFVLGTEDIARLKRAGASEALITVMQGTGSVPAAGNPASEITDLALIVDYSGSMNAKMKDGATKVASAKKCVTDLIDKLPSDLNVALIVYGTSKKRGCEDIDIVQPLGPIDKAGLKSKINGFNATGMTPIATSLTKAGEELKKAKGGSAIVLVTDGAESCHGDPAGVAAKLAAEFGVKFGINVIGFGIEPQEKAQLADIAARGHGKLLTVENASELTDALKKVVEEKVKAPPPPAQRETKQYEAAGKAVQPGAFFGDAGSIQAGEYAGKLAMKEAHYYQVPVHKGQELRVVTAIKKTPIVPATQALTEKEAVTQQDFNITLYNSSLNLLDRQVVNTPDNPTSPVTIRSTWTADVDGIVYVCIGASINFNGWGLDEGKLKAQPAPSDYTLRIRLEGEASPAGDLAPAKLLAAKAGNNYQTAGEISESGLVSGDLKYGETAFFSGPVKKGDVLEVGAAAQKPYGRRGGFATATQETKGSYQITVYDDDQVEAAKKAFDINGNPPDAASAALTWPVSLNGKAYITISAIKADQIPDDPKTPPGRFAIWVHKPGGKEASAESEKTGETAKPAETEKPAETPTPGATKPPADPFAGAESTPG
jgi:hypothetical protein